MIKVRPFGKAEMVISEINDGNMSVKYGAQQRVVRNRKRWFEKIGVASPLWLDVSENQFEVKRFCGDVSVERVGADAVVMTNNFRPVWVMVADCYVVVICDQDRRLVAIAHVGRAQLRQQLIGKVCQEMSLAGAELNSARVWIGPGICQNEYVFDEGLVGVEERKYVQQIRNNRAKINLKLGIFQQCRENGIGSEKIVEQGSCTYENKRLFSHRRSVELGEVEGRFGVMVLV